MMKVRQHPLLLKTPRSLLVYISDLEMGDSVLHMLKSTQLRNLNGLVHNFQKNTCAQCAI